MIAPELFVARNALAVSEYGYVLSQESVEREVQSSELAQNEHIRAAYLGL